jgi:hypothetical protein
MNNSAGTAPDSMSLQGQIQTALRNDPTVANDNINVNVSTDTIDLSGTVGSGKEKQTAKRLAESYAGARKVVDRLTVSGRGPGANVGASHTDMGPGASSTSGATQGTSPGSMPTGTPTGAPAGTTSGSATGTGNSSTGQPTPPQATPPPQL